MHALKTSATVLAFGLAGSIAFAGAAQACGHMKSVKAKSTVSVAQSPAVSSTAGTATGVSIATSDVKVMPLPVGQPQAPATR